MFELEAGGEGGLCDFELLGRRLRGGQTMLNLVAGLRQRLRQRMIRVADHPREDLRRRGERAERGEATRGKPELGRRPGSEDVADRERPEQRPDQVRPAALMLFLAGLTVLVRPDRDVLSAVVGGELRAAERDGGRRERRERSDELLRGRAEPARPAGKLRDGG